MCFSDWRYFHGSQERKAVLWQKSCLSILIWATTLQRANLLYPKRWKYKFQKDHNEWWPGNLWFYILLCVLSAWLFLSKFISAPIFPVLSKCLLQSNHPRLKATKYSLTLTDLREKDEGTYSVSFGGNDVRDIISLQVLGENIVLYDTVKNTLLVVYCIPCLQ